jgi:hypothetical protein
MFSINEPTSDDIWDEAQRLEQPSYRLCVSAALLSDKPLPHRKAILETLLGRVRE